MEKIIEIMEIHENKQMYYSVNVIAHSRSQYNEGQELRINVHRGGQHREFDEGGACGQSKI